MFWRMTALSATSPVETILDKEDFTLESLLDEEEIIQECKALNSRLINFLRDKAQVERLLRYIVEDAPEDSENKLTFKFPFIACEIFTCEIDVILKTLVEDEELMNILFSFLEPNRDHNPLLAGYFSKVVVCLMLRKTGQLMNYVQAHQEVFSQLVDLIGITSIMEVLIRLVGADDHIYPNYIEVMQWLADSNLLEMIVDKVDASCPPEVQANAAETLCAIMRNAPSSLSTKLCSTSFVTRIFDHALEESQSKSGLVQSLSVCISLLDPKRSTNLTMMHSMRSQHMYETSSPVDLETVISAMLPKLSELITLLNVCSDEKVLLTTYGVLRPPLGKHRLKIVEFIAVLLGSGNEVAEKELVTSGAIQRIIDLFFEYPFHSALHHHVESIITSCLDSKNDTIVDHLFKDCNIIEKFVKADRNSVISDDPSQPTTSIVGRKLPRLGNIGHITRISNKLVQLGHNNNHINAYLQENVEWAEWQSTALQERNILENVNRWACGRPSALQDRTRDSDDDELHERDYDVATLANNLSQAFAYSLYGTDSADQGHGSLERDDEDVYFDDDSAEVVISSLRLGDDQDSSMFTNSNWFAFQEDRIHEEDPMNASPSENLDEINFNGTTTNGSSSNSNSSSDDEVVVGDDVELGTSKAVRSEGDLKPPTENKEDLFGDQTLPDWVGWRESSDSQVGGPEDSQMNGNTTSEPENNEVIKVPNGTGPSLFEEDVEFVGVEMEGTEKAMEHALKEGIVGEAGPLKKNLIPPEERPFVEKVGDGEMLEFNDANYWRVDQDVTDDDIQK